MKKPMKPAIRVILKILLGIGLLLTICLLFVILIGIVWLVFFRDEPVPVWFAAMWGIAMAIALLALICFGIVKGVKTLKESLPEKIKEWRIALACWLKDHDWNGCVCRRCGKKRDDEHDWSGCVCRRCGNKRDEEHDWDGCVCLRCGKKRDEGHEWDECVCRRCGNKRDVGHDWNGCTCLRCGLVRDEWHEWEKVQCEICGGTGHVSGGTGLSYGDPGYGGDVCDACLYKSPIWLRCKTCGKEKDLDGSL